MAKKIIHVGLAVSTDGFIPGDANIINIAACVGDLRSFNQNVLPVSGSYGKSEFWAKHPKEYEELLRSPMALTEALKVFKKWLGELQGQLVACSSCVDFWHLSHALRVYGDRRNPFGSQPMDTNSYAAALAGRKSPGKITDAVLPVEVAKERWNLVSGGVLPKMSKPSSTKPKLTLRGYMSPIASTLRATMPRWEDTPQTIPIPTTSSGVHAQSMNIGNLNALYRRATMAGAASVRDITPPPLPADPGDGR